MMFPLVGGCSAADIDPGALNRIIWRYCDSGRGKSVFLDVVDP